MAIAALKPAEDDVIGLIDTDRYPIHDLDSAAGQALLAQCREQMKATGSCLLPGFLTPAAVARMAAEAAAVAPSAHHRPDSGTSYLEAPDESFPEGHPKRRLQTTSLGAVAYDLIPRSHALRHFYEWDGVLTFLARALGREEIHRYGDPMGALNVAVMRDGDHLHWHFDQTDFVVSILLQAPERGGEFEYVPYIRTPGEANYGKVGRLLDGDLEGVIRLDIEPGTMALFEGRYSIHRVTRIDGPKDRLMALLGYDTKPGTMSTDRLRQRRYGRLTAQEPPL
ncbi:MAG TPA: hypothetical protein VNT30_22795 [Stellaceae bacterium]|nr:hypothetical protein [Stellaceae bacterium]